MCNYMYGGYANMGGWLDSCLLVPAASTVLTHQHHQIISSAINVIIAVLINMCVTIYVWWVC